MNLKWYAVRFIGFGYYIFCKFVENYLSEAYSHRRVVLNEWQIIISKYMIACKYHTIENYTGKTVFV